MSLLLILLLSLCRSHCGPGVVLFCATVNLFMDGVTMKPTRLDLNTLAVVYIIYIANLGVTSSVNSHCTISTVTQIWQHFC